MSDSQEEILITNAGQVYSQVQLQDENVMELVECEDCGLYVLKSLYSEHQGMCTNPGGGKQMNLNCNDKELARVVNFLNNSTFAQETSMISNLDSTKAKAIKNLPHRVSCSFCKKLIDIGNLKSHLIMCKQKNERAKAPKVNTQTIESPEFVKSLKEISLPPDCSVLCSYCKNLVVVESLLPHLELCKQKFMNSSSPKSVITPKLKRTKTWNNNQDHLYSKTTSSPPVKRERRFFDLSKNRGESGTAHIKVEVPDDFIIGI